MLIYIKQTKYGLLQHHYMEVNVFAGDKLAFVRECR